MERRNFNRQNTLDLTIYGTPKNGKLHNTRQRLLS